MIGDVDQPHTFTFIRDFARGLVTLGTRDEALGQVWHVPSAQTTTQRALLGLDLAGGRRGDSALQRGARLAGACALGLVSPIMRELAEMLYEWSGPTSWTTRSSSAPSAPRPRPIARPLRETVAWFGAPRG